MSPAGQGRGSLPHNNSIAGYGVEHSNSTANKFLGANTRRPWMVGAGAASTTAPPTNTRRPPPVQFVQPIQPPRRNSHNGQQNPQNGQSGQNGFVGRADNPSGGAQTINTCQPLPLPSPGTASASFQGLSLASPTFSPDRLSKLEGAESTASQSLNPGLGITHHLPVTLVTNDQIAATAAQNNQRERGRPDEFVSPISGDNGGINTPSNQSSSRSTQPPYSSAAPSTPLTPTTHPDMNTASAFAQADFDRHYWYEAQQRFDQLNQDPSGLPSEWGPAERYRLLLISTALQQRDLNFLVLHQAYCLVSLADAAPATWLDQLRSCGFLPGPGLDALKQCLVDNQRLRSDFLHWAARFPRTFPQALTSLQYTKALWEVGVLLSELGKKWGGFSRAVYDRAYPPLVSELSRLFPMVSAGIKYILWTALCRAMFAIENDTLVAECRAVYDRDCAQEKALEHPDPNRTTASIQQGRQHLVNDYLQIAQRYGIYPGRLSRTSIGPLPSHGSAPNPQYYFHHPPPSGMHPSPQQLPPPGNGVTHHSPPIQRLPSNAPIPQQQMPVQQSTSHMHPPHGTPMQAGQPLVWRNVSRPAPQTVHTTPTTTPPGPRRGRPPNRSSGGTATPSGTQPRTGRNNFMTVAQPLCPQVQHPQHGVVPSPTQSQPPYPTPFLPFPGEMPITTAKPSPSVVAAHQVDLRSPPTTMVRSGPDGKDQVVDFFQYLQGFAVAPAPLGFTEPYFRWKISVSDEQFARLPRFHMSAGAKSTATRILSKGSLSFLLRCCQLRPSEKDLSESTWSTRETTWPSVFYIHVNDQELSARRKTHWGKDSALDVTKYLRPGQNEVTFHIIRSQAETKTIAYALAVEVHEANTFKQIRKHISILPSVVSKEQIVQRLSSTTDDDDLAVINDYITIGLIDPFMARIFNIPARGRTCTHWECFDLDTFLQTRLVKSKAAAGGEVATSNSRTWKCPICGRDARPKSLTIDGFLMEVHTQLKNSQCLEDTRSIQVKKDGTWTPIREMASGTPQPTQPATKTAPPTLSSPSVNGTQTNMALTGGVKRSRSEFEADDHGSNIRQQTKEITVIELD